MKIIQAQAVIGQTEQGEVVQELPHTDTTIDLGGMPVVQAGIPLAIEWTATLTEVLFPEGLRLKPDDTIKLVLYSTPSKDDAT